MGVWHIVRADKQTTSNWPPLIRQWAARLLSRLGSAADNNAGTLVYDEAAPLLGGMAPER